MTHGDLQAALGDLADVARSTPGDAGSAPPTPAGPAPLHRVVSRWFVASGTAGLLTTLSGILCGLLKEGYPRGVSPGEFLLRMAMSVVLVGAAVSPVEGLAALARRLGGRRRQGLVGCVALLPSLGLLAAIAAGLWLEAMEQSRDPTEALASTTAQLQGLGSAGLFDWKDLARFAGVLTALLVPIGVARAWDAGAIRTALAGVVGGLFAMGVLLVVLAAERSNPTAPEAWVYLATVFVCGAGALGLCLGDRLEAWLARTLSRHLLGREE